MKTVNCTALYEITIHGYTLHAVATKHRTETVELISLRNAGFSKFDDMYNAILNTLKINNYRVHTWEQFDSIWYDIDFIELQQCTFNKYPHHHKEETT